MINGGCISWTINQLRTVVLSEDSQEAIWIKVQTGNIGVLVRDEAIKPYKFNLTYIATLRSFASTSINATTSLQKGCE